MTIISCLVTIPTIRILLSAALGARALYVLAFPNRAKSRWADAIWAVLAAVYAVLKVLPGL